MNIPDEFGLFPFQRFTADELRHFFVVAYRALRDQLNPGEYGLFLGTAHPAKFKESVEAILGETLDLPKELAERADLPLLSHNLPADFAALRKLMMNHQ